MAQGQIAIGFNRTAAGLCGATGLLYLQNQIPNTVTKELNSIHISVADGGSPYVVEEYQIRVLISDQSPTIATILDFAPSNVSGTDNYGDPGNVYYDQVITIPYNNPILFDLPILFPGSTKIYVTCSIAYANSDSIITPTNRYVRMSTNGRLIDSPSVQYRQR